MAHFCISYLCKAPLLIIMFFKQEKSVNPDEHCKWSMCCRIKYSMYIEVFVRSKQAHCIHMYQYLTLLFITLKPDYHEIAEIVTTWGR